MTDMLEVCGSRDQCICGFILWSCACSGAVLLMAEVLSDQEWLLAGSIPSQLFKKNTLTSIQP